MSVNDEEMSLTLVIILLTTAKTSALILPLSRVSEKDCVLPAGGPPVLSAAAARAVWPETVITCNIGLLKVLGHD